MGTLTEIVCVCASLSLGLGALGVDWDVYNSEAISAPAKTLGTLAEAPAEAGQDGRLFVTGKVNGQSVRFLVDTGSTVTILNAQDAHRAGLARNSRFVPIQGLAGHVEGMSVSADELVIGKYRTRNIELFVVNHLEYSLLGIDMLRHVGPLHLHFGLKAD